MSIDWRAGMARLEVFWAALITHAPRLTTGVGDFSVRFTAARCREREKTSRYSPHVVCRRLNIEARIGV